ncbi:MAG: PPOX class F420-dependent oxidoreductase [Solirubrobacteraceae bacterium]
MAWDQEKYMLVTTFRRDGTPVATPVWVVVLDGGRLGFTTSSSSGKAKRLAHTSRVTVQPCNARGRPKPGTQPADATAKLVTGAELEAIRRRVVRKYGLATRVIGVMSAIAGLVGRGQTARSGVIVSLGQADTG